MDPIYIFGHQKPDTDSVTAAIALSYLEKKLGNNASPRILGTVNKETSFVLKYWKEKQPKRLNNVRIQVKDTNYLRDRFITTDFSIMDTFNYMMFNRVSTLPVINDKTKQLLGIISMKDIALNIMNGEYNRLNASYQNILNCINGTSVLKFDNKIEGNLLIASYKHDTIINSIELTNNDVLIVGDRYNVLKYAIESGVKLLIITGGNDIDSELLKLAENNKVNVIKTKMDTFATSKHIGHSNFVNTIINDKNIITFNEKDTIKDVKEIASNYKYSNYPVVNDNNECLGLLRVADVEDHNKKKCILVDHNEYEQSVEGLEEAEIVEIVDHHKIGTIGTTLPINFRTMPVGSTNTIIYQLYKENNIAIPKKIAGIMLSGILSDTLISKSPTTTNLDRQVMIELAKIADVNYHDYGFEMFKAGTSLDGLTKEEIIRSDLKSFNIDEQFIGVGQVFTLDIEKINKDKDKYIDIIEEIKVKNNYKFVAIFITDIIKNGSYIFYSSDAKKVFEKTFKVEDLKQGTFLPNIVSRKKQIIPNLMNVIGN